MNIRLPFAAVTAVLLLLIAALVIACGNEETGLSREDVEEIVREELARTPEPTPPEPGVSGEEVRETVDAAIASIEQPEAGLTPAEAERIARGVVALAPPRSDPAEYTRYIVESAISRYETQGREAAIAHYNRAQSVDGQWYVFIVDENGLVIAHPDPGRRGLDLSGWVSIDANGYNFRADMLSADEDGKWVSYVYQNPETGSITPGDPGGVQLKNVWVMRHDGLLFASGWYVDVDQFTQDVVAAVVDLLWSVGLEGTLEYLQNNPGNVLDGVTASAVTDYASGAAQGEWSIIIADETGAVAHHVNPAVIDTPIRDLLGLGASTVRQEGEWLTSDSMRIWVVTVAGRLIGAGWHDDWTGR